MPATSGETSRWLAWLACVGAVLAAAGCNAKNQDTAEVSGRVLLDGQPLTTGMVVFMSAQGPAAKGLIESDGSFRMEPYAKAGGHGVAVGRYQVVISANGPKASVAAGGSGGTPGRGPDVSLLMPASLIPEGYTAPATSGLACEVKPGQDNVVTFELVSSPR